MARHLLEKLLVNSAKPFRSRAKSEASKIRLSPRLVGHTNILIRMRYAEDNSVRTVLAWLKEQGCEITDRGFHGFMSRVLHLLPLEQARQLGVDVDFLRAVRVRYRLPVDPKRARRVKGKPAPRHFSRSKRRKIGLPRKPKPAPVPTTASVRQTPGVDAARPPVAGIQIEVATPARKLHGNPSKPDTLRYGDWKIINEEARTKIAKQSRQIWFDAGTVSNFKTRKQYTQEDLVKEFGLTPVEAQSCFLTLER